MPLQAVTSACVASLSDIVAQKLIGGKYSLARTAKMAVSCSKNCHLHMNTQAGFLARCTYVANFSGLPPSAATVSMLAQHFVLSTIASRRSTYLNKYTSQPLGCQPDHALHVRLAAVGTAHWRPFCTLLAPAVAKDLW